MQAYLDNMQCKLKRIFSEIDEPLDLNENTSTNIVFDVVS